MAETLLERLSLPLVALRRKRRRLALPAHQGRQRPRALLERHERTDAHTLGRLVAGDQVWVTMEPPWRDNAPNVSCIPPGVYGVRLRQSPRFGLRYWLQGTAPRTFVLIHAGNTVRHTLGCILPGMRAGWIGDKRAVLVSRRAVGQIEEYFRGVDEWDLEIRNV